MHIRLFPIIQDTVRFVNKKEGILNQHFQNPASFTHRTIIIFLMEYLHKYCIQNSFLQIQGGNFGFF